jgi:hypothetical protein
MVSAWLKRVAAVRGFYRTKQSIGPKPAMFTRAFWPTRSLARTPGFRLEAPMKMLSGPCEQEIPAIGLDFTLALVLVFANAGTDKQSATAMVKPVTSLNIFILTQF